MPDLNDTKTNTTTPSATSSVVVDPTTADPVVPSDVPAPDAPVPDIPTDEAAAEVDNTNIIGEVAERIVGSQNILVALSSDPSVDEMAAAIGLTLYLDRIGKHVVAIYSGNTPNALEFLKPDETFEQDTDVLQDFVIALNKEKADHLRYKLDGDYVKIFITPYRSRIGSEDLEFSYGDFNIDLVLALDVANGADLDDALREHGRIMHDAMVVNITTGKPGKLGEIEWSDKTASSISEMVAELLYGMNNKEPIGKEEATAFLTGIIAATNRFANATTTPRTMKISSRLMESGANQQLISKNITSDIENEFFNFSKAKSKRDAGDPTMLDIEHPIGDEEEIEIPEDGKEIVANVTEKDNALLDDLKAAEASLANAAAEVTEDEKAEPIHIDSENNEVAETPATVTAAEPSAATEIDASATPAEIAETNEPISNNNFEAAVKPEKVIAPPTDFSPETLGEGTNKYGQMLESALAEEGGVPTVDGIIASPTEVPNPAASIAPAAPTAPEINGVPEINYMPLPGEEVLPPPPAPPIDMNAVAPAPAMPADNLTPLGPQPAMQDQVYQPQAATPDSFKIPGT